MGSWSKWWTGDLALLVYSLKFTVFILHVDLCFFDQVRDEYRTDYDPDILFKVLNYLIFILALH